MVAATGEATQLTDGDKDETDGGTDVGESDTEEPVECELPQYDLTTMSCEQLGTAWANTVDAGNYCQTADDCTALRAECEHWENTTCWHAVNKTCVHESHIAAFNSEAASCFGQQCVCPGMPEVDCVAGRCQLL